MHRSEGPVVTGDERLAQRWSPLDVLLDGGAAALGARPTQPLGAASFLLCSDRFEATVLLCR